jgi:hypothetical protein
MQNHHRVSGIGSIFAKLALSSRRPRYAFLVLELVAEAANAKGMAGPFIPCGNVRMTLRDWLCTQLMPMSERDGRRAALRARIVGSLADRLTGNHPQDQLLIDAAVDDHVLAVGRANVSRAVSDLVRAGLVRRHYAGYATNHENRGGGRHAVYVIEPDILSALGKPVADGSAYASPVSQRLPAQGQLFAA